ncbi:testis-specific protein 10-interacting protein isoform X1 [Anolis carolinensis]|uniref:testis-specific protein 10-interacting protein isoform X1 n=2 Tax=Anolis carolinensis TaxID=28377 RepID=UPI002F2B3062
MCCQRFPWRLPRMLCSRIPLPWQPQGQHPPLPFHVVVVGAMLDPHRRSVLTNACVKAAVDPITRTPGTIYEPKGQVRLLGLLSESSPSLQEDYLDAGDGMLICMKRTNKMAPRATKKYDCEPTQINPNVSDASDTEPDPDSNRQLVFPTPDSCNDSPSPTPLLESTKPPRSGSFPFQWMWESFSLKGQAVYQDHFLEKAKKKKKKRSTRSPSLSIHEPPCTPEPGLVSNEDVHGLEMLKPPGVAEPPRSRPRHHKCRPHGGLPPGSSLFPLYWKMEARAEARKRQLRQERRRWLQLTQQLLSLEAGSPRKEKRLSVKQLEEKLRAELLCLATEPEEPGPQKGKGPEKAAAAAKREPTFKPTINRRIPNFKSLQRRFQEQLAQKKEQTKLTVCKPFRLHAASSSQALSGNESKQTDDEEDPFHRFQRLWGVQWQGHSCPDFSPPVVPPVAQTKTSGKRQEANRLLLLEWERRERQEKRRAEQRRAKEQQVQRDVAKCLATYRIPGYSPMSIQRRREELRRQEKQRAEDYTLQLQEIHERVESRPFLFERVMQANARQAVERRFSQVLNALGIDEEMLWKHAARPSTASSSAKSTSKKSESSEYLPEDFPAFSEDPPELKFGKQRTARERSLQPAMYSLPQDL